MLISAGIVAASWSLGFLFLGRIRTCPGAAADETCRPVTGIVGGPCPTVSVIVPARDEEVTLPELLASLRRQTLPPDEVIVVDDGSTDRTVAVARAGAAAAVPAGPRPDGWGGKTWPCWVGALRARGEVLVFLDADTRLAADGLERLVSCQRRDGGLVSVEPYHEVRCAHEQLSAFFNIVRSASVGAFTLLGDRLQPAGAFGPCIAMTRRDYYAVGGHSHPRVRDKVLENFVLGKVVTEAGLPLACYGGRGVLTTRMYAGGLRELVDGWSKAMASGAGGTPLLLLVVICAWVAGASNTAWTLPAAAVAGDSLDTVLGSVLYLAFAAQIWWMLRRLGSFSPVAALLFPVPLAAFVAIFARSLFLVRVRRRVVWRGRDVRVGTDSARRAPR